MKTGVYLCECGGNIPEKINFKSIQDELAGRDDIAFVKIVSLACSESGQAFIEEDLKKEKPDSVIVAACSPRDHEGTFRKVLSRAGMNPYMMQMTNIREQIAWVTADPVKATSKTLAYLKKDLARLKFHKPLEKQYFNITPDVLIIGSGPAGLQAAATLAEAGRKVYIIEKAPVIGGSPVRFEEVFPKMECGSCMLEPIEDAILHGDLADKIQVMTLSEVESITGFYGNFNVMVKETPRYLDEHTCIGCGECIAPCPVEAKNPFNHNMSERKAISFPFLGALPNAPYIDPAICLRSKGEDCSLCQQACIVDDCFQLDQQVSRHEIKVGAVLVAMGSSLYDVSMFPKLGYGTNPEVYTSAEFERILSATGPTNGEVVMRNGKAPKKIAIVHCVGSLDKHHREYCSGTCCQTAFKFNHGLSKKLPDLKFTHVYKELSMPGKDSSALFQNALHHGHTTLVRYENIDHLSATMHKEKTELSIKGDVIDSFDMIILMPAVVPSADTQKLANILDISLDQFGFFNELNSRISATQSNIKGIYLAGTCLGPKDIQQSVNDGVAAAGQALAGLIPGHKIEVEPITAEVNKDTCSGCRVCISVCPYKAISFIEAEKVSDVNVVLCQGCGTCVAACPSGSMIGNFFTNDEILAEIKEVLAS